MSDCIFCNIINGKDSKKTVVFFEDEIVLAIKPLVEANMGHTLVIPKKHYVDLFDIPPKVLEHLISISQYIAIELRDKHVASGINILHATGKDAGQSVPHFHFHVVPRFSGDGLDLWLKKNL